MIKIFTSPTIMTASYSEFGVSVCKYFAVFINVCILFIFDCLGSFMLAIINLNQRFIWIFKNTYDEILNFSSLIESSIKLELPSENVDSGLNLNCLHLQNLNKNLLHNPKEVFHILLCSNCRDIVEYLPDNMSKTSTESREVSENKNVCSDYGSSTTIPSKTEYEKAFENHQSSNSRTRSSKTDVKKSFECSCKTFSATDIEQPKNEIALSPKCQINDIEIPIGADSKNISPTISTFQREICHTTVTENVTKFSSNENFLNVPSSEDEFENIDLSSPESHLKFNPERSCLRLRFEETPRFSNLPPEKERISFFARKWQKWVRDRKSDMSYSSIARDGREDISSTIRDYKSVLTNREETCTAGNNNISFLVKEGESPVANGCCCNMFLRLKDKLCKYNNGICVSYKRF